MKQNVGWILGELDVGDIVGLSVVGRLLGELLVGELDVGDLVGLSVVGRLLGELLVGFSVGDLVGDVVGGLRSPLKQAPLV